MEDIKLQPTEIKENSVNEKDPRQEYRDQLAEKLKDMSKEERIAFLNEERKNKEYWRARECRRSQVQSQEVDSNDSTKIHIKNMHLYHGGPVPDIEVFKPAEDATVGAGLYTTSGAKEAIDYARKRAQSARDAAINERRNENANPQLYEINIRNAVFANFLDYAAQKKLLEGFYEYCNKLLNDDSYFEGKKWYYHRAFTEAVNSMESNIQVGELKNAVGSLSEEFAHYLKELGYDGLVTLEGGESSGDINTGDHDSYVIFDPEKYAHISDHQEVNL
jgi:hypothetical protein